jgi:hypothetical protein
MNFDWAITVLPYGDMWRRKRKLVTAHIHAGVAARYHPEPLRPAVSLFLGQVIIKAVYGIDVKHVGSEYITYPERIVEGFSIACTPGRFMIDFLPFCQYLTLAMDHTLTTSF